MTALIVLVVGVAVGLCACGFVAGRIYELNIHLRRLRQVEADDLTARDAWANQREQGAA